MAFSLVSTIEVTTSGVSQMNFENIPQYGQDLVILLDARGSNAAVFDSTQLFLNGLDTNFAARAWISSGSTLNNANSPGGGNSATITANNATTGFFGNTYLRIGSYSSTNWRRTIFEEGSAVTNASTGSMSARAIQWMTTNAITSVGIRNGGIAFVVGTSASLYIIS